MALPAPNLDDRRFQNLVDEAKRYVQLNCPEWSDHNVSDPGVTLIELFAWMTDLLLYRLNRVPDRNYLKFLELLGVSLFPPTAARTGVTFWLSAPQPDTIHVPAGTEVATVRDEEATSVSFSTAKDLAIVPCSLLAVVSSLEPGVYRDHTGAMEWEKPSPFFCFDRTPKPDDTLLVGLTNPVPSCAVALRFECTIEGIGVDPRDPPLIWEAWDGARWIVCEVDRDGTGGLNRNGDVVLHVPPLHDTMVISERTAAWVRCRVIEAREGQPAYSAPPRIDRLSAFTIGGTVDSANAEVIEGEVLGASEGLPGQRLKLKRGPVVAEATPRVLEVGGEQGWSEWTEVPGFADSGADDIHFRVDAVAGEVVLGPAVREPDGLLHQYGAVPPKGSTLRLRSYRIGGGRKGNVTRGALRILKSSLPYIARVENRHPARGGVDAEDVENAKLRGPLLLRTGNRAVTIEDYEHLAREAAPEVARVKCVPAGDGTKAGAVRVLVVPTAADQAGVLRFEQLVPPDELVEKLGRYLDERRVIGVRVVVEPPVYQGITIVANLRGTSRADPTRLEKDARDALYEYFHPIRGGPSSEGWPFGRPVMSGEVFSVLQRVRGIEIVEKVRLYAADATTGKHGQAVERIDLPANGLVFSFQHQVQVAAT